MKNKILSFSLMAAVAASLASCSNDDQVISAPITDDGSINFGVYTPGAKSDLSRAGSLTSDNIDNFGVFAYYDGVNAYSQDLTPNFMYNQSVAKSGSLWAYNPIKYWNNDVNHKISFFGYTPYEANPAAVAEGKTGVIAMSANDVVGDPTINFEIGTSIADQIDLGYAKAIDQTNAVGTVNLNFKHALSRLHFNVVAWEPGTGETFDGATKVTINAVKFATNRKSATLNLNTGLWSDIVNVDDADADVRRAYTVGTVNSNIQNNEITANTAGATATHRLNLDDDYLMVFPDLSYAETGADPDEYIIFVDYTIETADAALEDGVVRMRHNVYRRLTPQFEAGKSYAITIHLGLNGYTGPDDGNEPGDVPTDPDPDPDEPVIPTPPGEGGYVKLTSVVTDWSDDNGLDLSYGHQD